MIINKKIAISLIAIIASLISFSVTATPADMSEYKFFNETNEFYSLSVNGGNCLVDEIGFSRPGAELKILPSVLLKKCGDNKCNVAIHMTKDCSGPIMGSIFLNIDSGIISTYVYAYYKITYYTGSNLQTILISKP